MERYELYDSIRKATTQKELGTKMAVMITYRSISAWKDTTACERKELRF